MGQIFVRGCLLSDFTCNIYYLGVVSKEETILVGKFPWDNSRAIVFDDIWKQKRNIYNVIYQSFETSKIVLVYEDIVNGSLGTLTKRLTTC